MKIKVGNLYEWIMRYNTTRDMEIDNLSLRMYRTKKIAKSPINTNIMTNILRIPGSAFNSPREGILRKPDPKRA